MPLVEIEDKVQHDGEGGEGGSWDHIKSRNVTFRDFKKIFGSILISFFLLAGCDTASVPVKKSKTNICHKNIGSRYNSIACIFKNDSKPNRIKSM